MRERASPRAAMERIRALLDEGGGGVLRVGDVDLLKKAGRVKGRRQLAERLVTEYFLVDGVCIESRGLKARGGTERKHRGKKWKDRGKRVGKGGRLVEHGELIFPTHATVTEICLFLKKQCRESAGVRPISRTRVDDIDT